MKKRLLIICLSLSLIVFPQIIKGASSSFELDSYNTSYSSKGSLWYFYPGNATFGVSNFRGGVATIRFRKVIRHWPDENLVTFHLDSNRSSHYSRQIKVSDQNGYYYQVDRISGYPKGTAFGR